MIKYCAMCNIIYKIILINIYFYALKLANEIKILIQNYFLNRLKICLQTNYLLASFTYECDSNNYTLPQENDYE